MAAVATERAAREKLWLYNHLHTFRLSRGAAVLMLDGRGQNNQHLCSYRLSVLIVCFFLNQHMNSFLIFDTKCVPIRIKTEYFQKKVIKLWEKNGYTLILSSLQLNSHILSLFSWFKKTTWLSLMLCCVANVSDQYFHYCLIVLTVSMLAVSG